MRGSPQQIILEVRNQASCGISSESQPSRMEMILARLSFRPKKTQRFFPFPRVLYMNEDDKTEMSVFQLSPSDPC